MSDASPPRWRRRALMATAATAVVIVGAAAWVLGPGAPGVVAWLADGRAVWRLGDLTLEGVSGAHLGDLRAARATLRDEDGVWAEARDITLEWDPLRILSGDVAIRAAGARGLTIHRQPKLTPPRPPGRSLDVELAGLSIARIDIAEPVFGEAAAFSLDGGLATRGAHIDAARANLKRLDAAGDTLTLDFTRLKTVRLDLALDSPAGGFFAAALDTTDPVRLRASAKGDSNAGEGVLDGTIGDRTLAKGAFSWTQDRWRGGADLNPGAAPAFAPIVAALGDRMRIEGAGDRADGRAFSAQLAAPHAQLDVSGRLGDDFAPDGALQIAASADRIEAFTPGVRSGRARFEGAMTRENDVTVFDGRIAGTGIDTAGIRTTFAGPARVRLTRALVDVETEVALSDASGLPEVTRLLRDGRAIFAGRFDRAAQRFAVRTLRVTSPQADVRADGALGEGAPGLKGQWTITRLAAVDPRVGGAATGRWSLVDGFGGKPFVVDVSGAAQRFTTTLQPLDQLLGAAPALDAQFAIRDAIEVRKLIVTAPQLRFGATGTLRGDIADLALEASMTGPVRVGAAAFTGVADATGKLDGRLDNPTLSLEARLSQLDVAGLAIEAPVVTLAFAPKGAGREGRIDIVGAAAGEAATAHALLAADDNGLSLNNLQIAVAGLTAQGEAAFTHAGPSVNVVFAGPVDKLAAPLQGRARGAVRLTPGADGAPVLDAALRLVQGRVGTLALSRLDVRAQGPLDQVALDARVRGVAAGSDVSFDAKGLFAQTEAATRLALEGAGAIDGSAIATTTPFEARLAGGATTARGAFSIGDGAAEFSFEDTSARTAINARLDNAPIAPIFALVGERATGRASGTFTAAGDGALDAKIDMAITDALFARRARDPLNMTLDGAIANGRLRLAADVTSRNGLDAHVDAEAPVDARARPLRVALAGEGRARWRAKGPADALWGLVGSLDQSVTGQVDGEGDIRFATNRLSGSGALTLAGGRFADKLTGLDLRDIAARVSFADDAARLESFSARDARGGTVTATGRADGLKDGHIDLVTRDIQLIARPDARATGSGPLSLRWTTQGITLTGDLNIDEATLAPPRAAENIAELDVIEINRPISLAIETEKATVVLPTTTLDVRVRAPGRVFLRGRGLDSEWALDMRVGGTAAAPKVYGEARLVRGRFTLAGRPFEAERGLIRFNGDPEEALIDLVAELAAPEITARVALSGAVSDPDISLSSTPSLPEDEILPQALFGRASEDLSALEAAQLAASLAELAGQASLNLAGAARDLVGLDRLDVREEAGTGLRVAGGKYLTRDVYLEVARNGVGGTETQVEWRVRPQLFLISAFEPNGDRRLSVRWRREY